MKKIIIVGMLMLIMLANVTAIVTPQSDHRPIKDTIVIIVDTNNQNCEDFIIKIAPSNKPFKECLL